VRWALGVGTIAGGRKKGTASSEKKKNGRLVAKRIFLTIKTEFLTPRGGKASSKKKKNPRGKGKRRHRAKRKGGIHAVVKENKGLGYPLKNGTN